MACNAARLSERTAGRRVPIRSFSEGGVAACCALLRIVCALPIGWCGAGDLREPHSMRWVPLGAELRRYGKPHTSLRRGRERAEHFQRGQGGRELCDALEAILSRFCTLMTFSVLFHILPIPKSSIQLRLRGLRET